MEKKGKYIIAWEANTFKTRYYNGTKDGTSIMGYAETFSGEDEALEVIERKGLNACYVMDINFE